MPVLRVRVKDENNTKISRNYREMVPQRGPKIVQTLVLKSKSIFVPFFNCVWKDFQSICGGLFEPFLIYNFLDLEKNDKERVYELFLKRLQHE